MERHNAAVAIAGSVEPLRPMTRLLHPLLKYRLLILTTAIPTILSALYFGLIASDIYVSESRFVVRSPDRQVVSPVGQILKSAGFTRSQDDAYSVQDFILSRDALKAVDEGLQVKKAFSAPSIDMLSRFPGFDWDDSYEAFHIYYQKKIDVRLDSASSIATLVTRAFSANDAHAINLRLLELAEELVNKLNERGREDMIRFAVREVDEARKKAGTAALALASYRNEKGVIDPEKQSAIPLQQIAKLQDELVAAKTLLAQLQILGKDNPQIPALTRRIQSLNAEIESESRQVTGGERSLAGKAADFHRLTLEKEFADKMLASAMSMLEQARNEAQRKQLYLERIVQPSKPDKAREPRRLRAVLATLVLGLVAWGVLSLLLASVREHME